MLDTNPTHCKPSTIHISQQKLISLQRGWAGFRDLVFEENNILKLKLFSFMCTKHSLVYSSPFAVEIYCCQMQSEAIFLTTVKSSKNRSASDIRISDKHESLINSLHKAVQL